MSAKGPDSRESLHTLSPSQSPSRRQSHGSLSQWPSDIQGSEQGDDAGDDAEARTTSEDIASTSPRESLHTSKPSPSLSQKQSQLFVAQDPPATYESGEYDDTAKDAEPGPKNEDDTGRRSPESLRTLSSSQSPSQRQSQNFGPQDPPATYEPGHHDDIGNDAEPGTQHGDITGRRSQESLRTLSPSESPSRRASQRSIAERIFTTPYWLEQDNEQEDTGKEGNPKAEEVKAERAPPRTSAELRAVIAAAHHERVIDGVGAPRPNTPVPSLPSGMETFWQIPKPLGEHIHRGPPPQALSIQEEQVDHEEIYTGAQNSGDHTLSPYTDSTPNQKKEQSDDFRHPDSIPSTLPTRPAPDRPHSALLQQWANFFTTFSTHGFPLAFGILLPFYGYVPLLGHSAAAVTVIGSLSLGAPFVASWLVDPLFAAGYFRYIFHGGSLGLVGALIGSSFCSSIGCFLATQGVLVALTGSCVFCAGVLVLQTYFEGSAGQAMSIGAAGASVGGVVYTVLTQQLLPVIGLPWTLRALSLVALLSLIFPNVVVRPQSHQAEQSTDGTEEAADKPVEAETWDAEFVLLMTGLLLVFLTLYFPYYYLPTFAILALSTNPTRASFLLLTLIAVTIPFRLLARPLAARLGLFNTLVAATFLSAALTMLLIPTTTMPSLHILATCYGISSAGILALYPASIAAVNMRTDAEQARTRRRIAWTGMGMASMAGPVIAGVLMEVGVRGMGNERGFVAVHLWAGACMAAGGACFLGVRVVRAGWGVVMV